MRGEENIIINRKKLIGVVGTAVSGVAAIIFFLAAFYYDVGAVVIGNTSYLVYDSYGEGGLRQICHGELTIFHHLFLLLLILALCVSIISTAYFSRSFFKVSRSLSSRKGIIIVPCSVCAFFFIAWLAYLPMFDGWNTTLLAVYWEFRGLIIFAFIRDALTAFVSIFICIKVFKVKRKKDLLANVSQQ